VESKNKIPFRGKACLKEQNKFCLSLRKILEDTRKSRKKKKGNTNHRHLASSIYNGRRHKATVRWERGCLMATFADDK